MRGILYIYLIFGLCVDMYLSQDAERKAQGLNNNVVKEMRGPDPYGSYDDPIIGANCYREENHCDATANYIPKTICVYKKKLGLTNFLGLCAIKLQNCLITQQKKLNDGSASLDDEIYHNGKSFDCQYYGAHARSEKQAVIWYFKLGGLDAEKLNITQPFDIY